MALAGWVAGLKKGTAVTFLPDHGNRKRPWWVQLAVVVVSLAMTAVVFYVLWISLPRAVSRAAADGLAVAGLLLFLGGLGFTLWARRTLGAMWGISTSREVKLLADHELVTTGPYAMVRHPMYFGWWLSVTGLIAIYRMWVLVGLLLMSLVIFYRRAKLEERTLEERFGDEWRSYVVRSKFLVPFIF
jgi:protein-S-isoprenylcysteine O-methyltransferase Ste14